MAESGSSTQAIGALLTTLAREAVETYIKKRRTIVIGNPNPVFARRVGVFVTIKRHTELRGCIGYTESPWPLSETLVRAAISSATEDPRFPPVTQRELPDLVYEVTILTEPVQIHPDEEDLEKIVIGRDGLMIDAYGFYDVMRSINATACGYGPITTLMLITKAMKGKMMLLNHSNSGDASRDYSSVVGYASILAYRS